MSNGPAQAPSPCEVKYIIPFICGPFICPAPYVMSGYLKGDWAV